SYLYFSSAGRIPLDTCVALSSLKCHWTSFPELGAVPGEGLLRFWRIYTRNSPGIGVKTWTDFLADTATVGPNLRTFRRQLPTWSTLMPGQYLRASSLSKGPPCFSARFRE